MAATHFSNGDVLTTTFVNSIYDAGGHAHDGTDMDGHAQKIDLTRDTAGVLPSDRISWTDGSFVLSFSEWSTDGTCSWRKTAFPAPTATPWLTPPGAYIVQLSIPDISTAASGEHTIITSSSIPTDIRPGVPRKFERWCTADGTEEMAQLFVSGSHVLLHRWAENWKNACSVNGTVLTYQM